MAKKRITSQEVDEALCAAENLEYEKVTAGDRHDFIHYVSYLSETAKSVARGVRARHLNRVSG